MELPGGVSGASRGLLRSAELLPRNRPGAFPMPQRALRNSRETPVQRESRPALARLPDVHA
eukprot:11986388-Alexandrium_andersonii.AAC.1